MTLEEVESLLLDTYELCRNVSTSEDAMAKAERAVAFHRKLAEQGILRLTSEMEEMLAWCESVLSIGALGSSFRFSPSLLTIFASTFQLEMLGP